MAKVVGGVLFLLCAGWLAWLGMSSTAPPDQFKGELVVRAAAKVACDGLERFPDNLANFRSVLASADPDTTQFPETWTALKKLVETVDAEAGKQNGKKIQANPEMALGFQNLIAACGRESAALQNREVVAEKQLPALAGAASGLVAALVLFGLFARERALAREISVLRLSAKNSLRDQIRALLAEHQFLTERYHQQERLSLEQALFARRQKRTEKADEDPVPPSPPPPPPPRPDDFTEEESSDPRPARPNLYAVSPGTSFTLDEPEDSSSTEGSSENRISLVPSKAHEFKTVPDLLASLNGPLVVIAVEDVDLLHHLYTRPEAVLRALLEHIAGLLLENQVRPEEIALGEDSVHWALPREAHASELQVNKFVLDLYRNSVFRFQGKPLDSPAVSVTMSFNSGSVSRAAS